MTLFRARAGQRGRWTGLQKGAVISVRKFNRNKGKGGVRKTTTRATDHDAQVDTNERQDGVE